MCQAIGQKILSALEFTSGCTEPAAIALAAAWTGKVLGQPADRILVTLDHRTYKNAFNAGIPNGQGHTGTEFAAAFGFLAGGPERKLAVFDGLEDEHVKTGIQMVAEGRVDVQVLNKDRLDVKIEAIAGKDTAQAQILDSHTRVVRVEKNGEIIHQDDNRGAGSSFLTFDDSCYDWRNWSGLVEDAAGFQPLREKVEQGIQFNTAAADHGQTYINGGHDDLVSGAIFSRMSGDPVMVMSCAGSGNKGLTSIIPVIMEANRLGVDEEKRSRAVIMSALVTSLVTARFGAVSSTCGVLYGAGTGLVAAFLYLRDKLDAFPAAYHNYISSVSGGFCDGAKGSCAMRGNSAVANARIAVTYAIKGFGVRDADGFLGTGFKETLDNLIRYNPTIAQMDQTTIEILQGKKR